MALSLYWQNFYWTMQGLDLFSSGYLEYHISLNSKLPLKHRAEVSTRTILLI